MGKDLKGKELGKGITQRKDGKYHARYVDRFGNRKSVYSRNKAEIKKLLAEAIKDDSEKSSVKKQYSLNEWYKQWMTIYKIPVIRANTKRHYEHIFNKHILPLLGGYNLNDVKPMHVKELINTLDKNGYQWETQNKVKILITDLYNRAIENDYALKNPTRGLRLKKSKPYDRIVLTKEQQDDFLECSAGTFYNNFFVLAMNTGLRAGEICALTMDDIDFKNKQISVTKTLLYQKLDNDSKKTFHLEPPKTYTSKRIVPLNDNSTFALKKQIRLKTILSHKYVKTEKFYDLLFTTKFNTPINAQILNDAIKRIINEVNIQREDPEKIPSFSSHTFRHTFATRCIENGVNPKTLQKWLGHATLEMTMNLYVHVTDEFMSEEIDKINIAI